MSDEPGPGRDDGDPGDERTDADGADDDWVSDSVDDAVPEPGSGGADADRSTDDAAHSPIGDGAGGTGGRAKGPDEKFCAECGAPIKKKAEICPECGVRQPGTASSDERLVAALLAILLGSFGAHKFYLDQTKAGIIYLCFFWTGIPGLIGIVEGVIYLTKSDEEFRRQYLDD